MSSQQQFYPSCPICNNDGLKLSLHCKDFSLTQEDFEILHCPNCSFQLTYPTPSIEKIAPYYNFTEYISHSDTNKGWMNRVYHIVRKYTLSQKTKWIQSLCLGSKGALLDIGAGTGAFANAMKLKDWNVTAVEPDETTRKRAQANYGIDLLPIDVLYTLPENSFDIITLWHVLEHVHDLNGYVNAFTKLLKPNGRLIIAVPNYTSFDAQFYAKYWAAYDVPRHLYHFSPNAMSQLCDKYHLTIEKIKPMWFDSFYVSLLSEKYRKSGFIGTLSALIVGAISNLIVIFQPKKASSVIYVIKHKSVNH